MFFTMAHDEVTNFKIKAYATEAEMLADTPVENTIGVETGGFDGYVLSGTAPENPTAGLLWVRIDSASPVKFPATQKKDIILNPVKAYIYHDPEDELDTGWTVVVSHLYANSKWDVFGRQYLYRTGAFNEELTGGKSTGYLPYSGNEVGYVVAEEKADHLLLDGSKERFGNGATLGAMFAFKKMIDLTFYKTLTFEGVFDYENANSHVLYGCWPADGDNEWPALGNNYREGLAASLEKTKYSVEPVVLDVTALSGKHLIGVGLRSCKVRIDECYLEM